MRIVIEDAEGNRAHAEFSGGREINTTDADHLTHRSSISGLGEWRMVEDNSPLRPKGEDEDGRRKFLDGDNKAWIEVRAE